MGRNHSYGGGNIDHIQYLLFYLLSSCSCHLLLIVEYLLLPQLLEHVAAGLQTLEDGVGVGLDHQQLGVMAGGAGGVLWPGCG